MFARVLDQGRIAVITELGDIRAAIAAKKPIWIELESQCAEADELLVNVLDVHPLTIEDVWSKRSAPKLEDYRNYLYVIFHAARGSKRSLFDLVELDVLIGKTFVITHDPAGVVTKEVSDELERDPDLLGKGPAWLAHAILDHAVDRYLPIIDELDDEVDKLETDALMRAGTRKGPPVLRRILKFKRTLQALRRMSIHQREILMRLSRGEFEEIPREVVPYFRDVHDHFLRINDLLEGFRDLTGDALEAYLSVQANRMSEVMKTLTLISTVMLPLTFIAGVYGMNFKYMPELGWIGGYPFALALMAGVAAGILLFFRRKGWLGGREEEIEPKAKSARGSK